MTEKARYQNQNFFDYCDSVGFFDENTSQRFRTEFRDTDQRQLIAELAKYFEYLTASDYYDFSNRFYMNWLAHQHQPSAQATSSSSKLPASLRKNPLEAPQRNSNSNLKDTNDKENQSEAYHPHRTTDRNAPSPQSQEEKEIEQLYNYSSKRPSKRSTSRRDPSIQNTSQENILGSSKQPFYTSSNKKIDRLMDLYSKLEKKMAKNSFKSARGLSDDSPYRSKSIERGRSPLVSPKKRHDELYEDYFTQNETKALKWHLYRLQELSDCTFVPQTNQVVKSPRLSELLKTPVFDRLSQTKPLKSNLHQHSFENRKLQGATFSPDIRKSQALFYTTADNRSPEAKKTEATARLYQKAQLKQRNLALKRIISHENEIKKFTFQPRIRSPTQDKRGLQQNIDIHAERMHSEAGRRKRDLVKKEGELRDKEMEKYTFTPVSLTSRYKSRSRSTSRSSDAFSRLYEEARKRHHLEKELERQIRGSDSSRNLGGFSNKKSERLSRSRSAADKKNWSIDAGDNLRQSYGIVSQFKDSEATETPAFDRLYNQRIKKEEKIKQLEVKVKKEQGITFKPKSMTKSYRPALTDRNSRPIQPSQAQENPEQIQRNSFKN